MTGKERSLAALAFEQTDRVPTLGGFVSHAAALAQLTGLDVWADPRRAALEGAKALGVDLIIQLVPPKASEVSTDMGDGRESLFTKREQARYQSPEQVRDYAEGLPTPAEVRRGFDFSGYLDSIYADWAQCKSDAGDDLLMMPYMKAKDCPFMYYSEFGYENYFQALALYPESMDKLFRCAAETSRCCNEAFVVATQESDLPPYVYIGQDICDNAGPMISPRLLDGIYFPHLRYCLEPLNDARVKKIWHSDGNINPIIDRLLEAGINGFQGLQEDTFLPESQRVSLESLVDRRDRWGDNLIIYGSISVRDVLPHGTVEDVKREVERCIDACRGRSGFFLGPTSTVGPDVSVGNIVAMYQHAREYGARE
ncbi:MAG: uroporphyrinogen decarboxylase family protein [Bacteroidota bacterium]